MKIIKIFMLFCAIFIFGENLKANDIVFESKGGHIVPMNMSNISIKNEKLHFKLQKGERKDVLGHEMLVTVKFVFDSPDAGEKYIGFITPEGGMYEWDKEENFKDFKTIVNGKEVDTVSYKLTDLIPKDVKEFEEVKKYFKEYNQEEMMEIFKYYKKSDVYYFRANFKKGENIVEHSYRYIKEGGSGYVDFDYVWTTISKWKNQKVDDFEVIVEPGNAFIEMPVIKMKNGKEMKWELVGEGNTDYGYKISSNGDGKKEDKYKFFYAKLKKGYLHFRTKDFKPEDEFYLTAITSLDAPNYYFPEKTEKGFKLRDNFSDAGSTGTNLEYHLEHYLKNITDDELKIIRNYPYALAGYDFSDKKLKDYFSKFLWYIPTGKNVTLGKDEYEWIKKADNIINSRKK